MFCVLDPINQSLTGAPLSRKDHIAWECDNGGQQWTSDTEAAADTSGTASFPSGFCASGFNNIYAAFIGGLLVDLVCQVCGFIFAFPL
jgi:hypothetical protein